MSKWNSKHNSTFTFDLLKWDFSTINIHNVAAVKFVAYMNEFVGTLSSVERKINNSIYFK